MRHILFSRHQRPFQRHQHFVQQAGMAQTRQEARRLHAFRRNEGMDAIAQFVQAIARQRRHTQAFCRIQPGQVALIAHHQQRPRLASRQQRIERIGRLRQIDH